MKAAGWVGKVGISLGRRGGMAQLLWFQQNTETSAKSSSIHYKLHCVNCVIIKKSVFPNPKGGGSFWGF